MYTAEWFSQQLLQAVKMTGTLDGLDALGCYLDLIDQIGSQEDHNSAAPIRAQIRALIQGKTAQLTKALASLPK